MIWITTRLGIVLAIFLIALSVDSIAIADTEIFLPDETELIELEYINEYFWNGGLYLDDKKG